MGGFRFSRRAAVIASAFALAVSAYAFYPKLLEHCPKLLPQCGFPEQKLEAQKKNSSQAAQKGMAADATGAASPAGIRQPRTPEGLGNETAQPEKSASASPPSVKPAQPIFPKMQIPLQMDLPDMPPLQFSEALETAPASDSAKSRMGFAEWCQLRMRHPLFSLARAAGQLPKLNIFNPAWLLRGIGYGVPASGGGAPSPSQAAQAGTGRIPQSKTAKPPDGGQNAASKKDARRDITDINSDDLKPMPVEIPARNAEIKFNPAAVPDAELFTPAFGEQAPTKTDWGHPNSR